MPLMSAGSTAPAIFENAIAPLAQSRAPRISLAGAGRAAASSIRTTTSGSSTADQSLEVAGPQRREEGLDHLAPLRALGNGDGRLTLFLLATID